MQTEIEFYREGGQWKIRMPLPLWVIDDILRDSYMHTRVVISLEDSGYAPGFSVYSPTKWDKKHPQVIGTVLFEETNVEPKDE